MFKLRLLTAAAAAAFLAGAATAQTSPQTSPPSGQQVGQPTSDAAAKAAKDQAMKGTMPSDSAQTSPSAQSTPSATTDQTTQAQPTTQQQAAAQPAGPATSKEGMSESTTRAWVEMDLEETTVGNSRLFVGTITDSDGDEIQIVTNGPVPDNATNRAEFPPLSAAGRRTRPMGN